MRNNDKFAGLNIVQKFIDLLFPRRCPVCDSIVPAGEGLICRRCVPKLQYVREPRCRRCGRQLSDSAKAYCGDCAGRRHAFDYGYALYDYGSMKNSIFRFKYRGRCEYAKFYAEDVLEKLGDEIRMMGADSIIPVPVHKSRLRRRGYNQAWLVAAELSKLTGIPMYDKIVQRTKKTIPQKELNMHERQNNLKKAFNVGENVVKLNKTILVDDIYTTGSTLDALALELKRRGAVAVYFVALCIGEGI